MLHRNAYAGPADDMKWFGQKNIDAASLALKEAGEDNFWPKEMSFVLSRIWREWDDLCAQHHEEQYQDAILWQLEGWTCQTQLLRLYSSSSLGKVSFTNNFPFLCLATVSRNGVRTADALFTAGGSVFGWDIEWNMNFTDYRLHRILFDSV